MTNFSTTAIKEIGDKLLQELWKHAKADPIAPPTRVIGEPMSARLISDLDGLAVRLSYFLSDNDTDVYTVWWSGENLSELSDNIPELKSIMVMFSLTGEFK